MRKPRSNPPNCANAALARCDETSPGRAVRAPGVCAPIEQLLAQIAWAARHCAELEAQFGAHPAPPLETLLKVYRVLILKLSAEANMDPEQLKLAMGLLRPVLEGARLDEQRKGRELSERKYGEQVRVREETRQRAKTGGGIKPETLEEIERQLKLI